MNVDFPVLADMGFSYFVVVLVMLGLGRAGARIWPWFTDTYWINREQRWTVMFDADKQREQALMNQSASFLHALESYQNGFASANSAQHEAIVAQLTKMNTDIAEYRHTTTVMVELLTARLDRSKPSNT